MQSHPDIKKLLTPKLTDYIHHVPTKKQSAFLWLDILEAFYGGAAGGGKILGNDGVILTPFGWKYGRDLIVGDLINNPDGTIQRVIQIKPEICLPLWRVYFSDGTFTDVAEDHLWLSWRGRKSRKIRNERKGGFCSAEIVETKTLMEWIARGYAPQIPVCKPQPFNRTTRELDRMDAYLLGVLLGDGCITHTQPTINITCSEVDKQHYMDIFGNEDISYKSKKSVRFLGEKNKYIKNKLELYNLLGTRSASKFIPDIYKFSDIESRWGIVQGLMDTDGYSAPNKNACYFDSTSELLSDDLAFILRSLGCVVTKTKGEGKYRNEDGEYVICNNVFSLYIKSENPDMLFRMKRKQHGVFGKGYIQKSVIKVEIDGEITGRCISVSNPNGLYITNDFIVTHNSDALLMAALQYVDTPGYNAIIIRDSYQNLVKPDCLVPRSHEWLHAKDAHWKSEERKWVFPSGATLSFGYLDSPNDHYNYQSAAFQFIGIDEATSIRENQALYLFSRLRKLKNSNVPLRFRVTSNPPQREQHERGSWVKTRYVNPDTRAQGVIFIPAWMDDNPFLDKESYSKSLENLDPVTREQLKSGNWDIHVIGRMFKREWFSIVPHSPVIGDRVRYWDLAATQDGGAFTSGCKLSKTKEGIYYVESIVSFQKSPRLVEQIIRQTAETDGRQVSVWMEQEPGSSGVNTIDHYRRNILPEFIFKGDKVTGSKVERAMPAASQSEAGNIFLVSGLWNNGFIEEIGMFPDGKYKDKADSFSGAFNKLSGIRSENRVRII